MKGLKATQNTTIFSRFKLKIIFMLNVLGFLNYYYVLQ